MRFEQGTKHRKGNILEVTIESTPTSSSTMTEVNSAKIESVEGNDVLSQLAEIRENYERKICDLQREFSQLKDLMMAMLEKSNTNSQGENYQGSSKQPKKRLDITNTALI